jgi:uncharacterized protein
VPGAGDNVGFQLDALNPPSNLSPAPLPLPPLPPETFALDPWNQPDPYAPGDGLLSYSGAAPFKPPRVWTVFVVFGVALLAGLVAAGIIPLIMVVAQHGEQFTTAEQLRDALIASVQQPVILLTSAAATQVMLLLTALSAAVLSPRPVLQRLRLKPSTLSPLGYIVAPIGAFAISILFGSLVTVFGIHETGTLKLLGDAFRHLSPAEVVFALLIVGVMPGFAEEFLFRGYIQTRLVQRLGRWGGILITAALFGIMHMDPLQGTFAIGFGIYIGYLADKAGSIRPAMVCHAFNNSVQVILGRYLVNGGQETPIKRAAIIALIAAAVVALCSLYIYFRVQPQPDGSAARLAPPAADLQAPLSVA